jgi:peptide deformylase
MIERTHPAIWVHTVPAEEKRLRTKAEPFDFSKMSYKEIAELTRRMRKIMKAANGIGLAANQIGLPFAMFVAEVESDRGPKFYAVFNPKIEKMEKDKVIMEEGCLSVPNIWGDVSRPKKVTLVGEDSKGRPLKIKAWGLLARVFQHEVGHLNGELFIDKAKELYKLEQKKASTIK